MNLVVFVCGAVRCSMRTRFADTAQHVDAFFVIYPCHLYKTRLKLRPEPDAENPARFTTLRHGDPHVGLKTCKIFILCARVEGIARFLMMGLIGYCLYRYVIFSFKISLNFQRLPPPPSLFT